MNNQMPYAFNPNVQQPMFPGVNEFGNQCELKIQNLEYKINAIENRLKNIESKLNIPYSNMDNNYNQYQSSMHMM